VKLRIPSKTFLIGEYAALLSAPALLITHEPFFEYSANETSASLAPAANETRQADALDAVSSQILSELPSRVQAGALAPPIEAAGQIDFSAKEFFQFLGLLNIIDPHKNRGGFGRSGAEFLIGSCLLDGTDLASLDKNKLEARFKRYYCDGEVVPPSGYDFRAQLAALGHESAVVECRSKNARVMQWPFEEVRVSIYQTGIKLDNRLHLSSLDKTKFESLARISEDCTNFFIRSDLPGFIDSMSKYVRELRGLELLDSGSYELAQRICEIEGVYFAKGCGGGGADSIAVFHRSDLNEQALETKIQSVSNEAVGSHFSVKHSATPSINEELVPMAPIKDQQVATPQNCGLKLIFRTDRGRATVSTPSHKDFSVDASNTFGPPEVTGRYSAIKFHRSSDEKCVAFASAPSNIALIKYMGKTDTNVPTNPSFSVTLPSFRTYCAITHYEAQQSARVDEISLEARWSPLLAIYFGSAEGSVKLAPIELDRDSKKRFLDFFKALKSRWNIKGSFQILSANNFASDCGLASSASSFAALTAATYQLAKKQNPQLELSLEELASISREGSGSSCRSFFEPFSLWDEYSARPADLPVRFRHEVILVDDSKKTVSSSEAHKRVRSSLLFEGRDLRARRRLADLLSTIHAKDERQLFDLLWSEFWDMHALFETSVPSFGYMTPRTLEKLHEIRNRWDNEGRGPLVTMDAGANIHLLYPEWSIP